MFEFVLSAFADEICEDLYGQIEALHYFDISHIEIRGVDKRNIIHHPPQGIMGIRNTLDKECVSVSSVGSPIGKTHIFDDFSAELVSITKALSAAELLGSRFVRVFSFYIPETDEYTKHRDEVLKRMEVFVKMAAGTGITLLCENEKGLYGNSPERCLDLMQELGCDNFKMVFDPANFVQCGFGTYPHTYNMLKRHIAYIHIKDACVDDGVNVPAGKGDGKIKEILHELADSGYRGFLSLEPHLCAFEGLSELERDPVTIKQSEYPRELFGTAVSALRCLLEEIC